MRKKKPNHVITHRNAYSEFTNKISQGTNNEYLGNSRESLNEVDREIEERRRQLEKHPYKPIRYIRRLRKWTES